MINNENIYIKKTEELKNVYRTLFVNENNVLPEAVQKKSSPERIKKEVFPTIPFIGKEYFTQETKVLVYASAENLSNYCYENTESNELYENDDLAINRHRNRYDKTINHFFPSVHLKPMTDGLLSTAVYYILFQKGLIPQVSPKEFYEKICFGNYGKFSLKGKKNIDYAYSKNKLDYSNKYVAADLDILNPDLIIVPKSIYDKEKEVFGNHRNVITMYQMNASNVNRIINGKLGYKQKNIDDIGNIKDWFEKIRLNGKSKTNYLCVFSYLDKIIKTEKKNKNE